MASTSGPNPLEETSTPLTSSSAPGTQPPLVEPSADKIVSALSPADADVFRFALDGVPLICRTPPAFMDVPPLPADAGTDTAASPTKIWALPIVEQPVPFYVVFTQMPGFFCGPGCIDDLRYAARAALRYTAEELDAQIEGSVSSGRTPTRATFKPLVSYRLACVVALMPLNLAYPRIPPPAVVRGYAWTWRTCETCARHVGHAPGDACGAQCADAPWFIELWKQLVAILRARPDPDAVPVRGWQHLSQALPAAMTCPTCSKVAHEHLRCFHGLLIVEIAKRIAEVPFQI